MRYKIKTKKPYIAYSGATIQQNYGENPGKGFLVWDIASKDSWDLNFCEIPHDRPFVTIEWKGSLSKTLDKLNISQGSRVRVRTDQMINQAEIKQLVNELKVVYNASEVVFKNDYSVDGKTIKAEDIQIQKDDLRNVDIMLKLFHGFIKENSLNKKEWKNFDSLAEKCLKKAIHDDESSRNVRWSVKRLEFENMWGYGKENFINFSNLSGITGIFGPNRIGKSSIIGSLMYSLFNDTDRGAMKNLHIINSRKGHCLSKLYLTANNEDFLIERQSVRKEDKKGYMTAVTSLNFFKVDSSGAVIKDLNGEQRTETEKLIRGFIGNSEDCMLTGIALQGDMNRFIEHGSTQRDKFISRFLDLEIFEKMSSYAKDASLEIRSKIKSSSERDWDVLIQENNEKLKELEYHIFSLEKNINEKRKSLDSLKLNLSSKNYNDIVTRSDIDATKLEIVEIKNRIEETSSMVDDYQLKLSSLLTETKDIEDKTRDIQIENLKKRFKAYQELKVHVNELQHGYINEKNALERKEKSALKLLDVPCGDEYPQCKYIKDSYADKKDIPGLKSELEKSIKRLEEAKNSLNELNDENLEKQINEYESLLKKKSDVDIKIEKAQRIVENKLRDLQEEKKCLNNLEFKLADFLSKVIDDEEDKNDVSQLKAKVLEIERSIKHDDSERISLASEVGRITNTIESLASERDFYNQIKSDFKVFELFISACSKKGIPSQIINSQLPVINAEIEKLLHGIVDFTVVIEKDIESNSTDIFLDYGDSKRILETGSGMEKMISALAIRVALLNASSLPRPDFLIIDEGFGSLDDQNVEACSRFLKTLKGWFKNIILITHVDAVKEIADNVIEITRSGIDSKVQF